MKLLYLLFDNRIHNPLAGTYILTSTVSIVSYYIGPCRQVHRFLSEIILVIKVAHHTWIKFLKSRRNSLITKNKVTYHRYECTKST